MFACRVYDPSIRNSVRFNVATFATLDKQKAEQIYQHPKRPSSVEPDDYKLFCPRQGPRGSGHYLSPNGERAIIGFLA